MRKTIAGLGLFAAAALTTVPINRSAVAQETGLAVPLENAVGGLLLIKSANQECSSLIDEFSRQAVFLRGALLQKQLDIYRAGCRSNPRATINKLNQELKNIPRTPG